MKFYVAGRTTMVRHVRMVQEILKANNHEITYDWTVNVESEGGPAYEGRVPDDRRSFYAQQDATGVYACDVVVVVPGPGVCGTLIEIGMGLAWNRPIWLLGPPERDSVFFALPHFSHFDGMHDERFLDRVKQYDPKRLEREPSHLRVLPRLDG